MIDIDQRQRVRYKVQCRQMQHAFIINAFGRLNYTSNLDMHRRQDRSRRMSYPRKTPAVSGRAREPMPAINDAPPAQDKALPDKITPFPS